MDSIFSGEEAYGKHLDLYIAHSQYLNLEGSTR
jgi:splicing factor 3A subunit 3